MENSTHKSVVAVTGGLGTGKSSFARLLADRGAVVVSADELARKAVQPGSPALDKITAAFGQDILRPDGTLDRKRLGSIVFRDAALRKELESIVHPEVRHLSAEEFKDALSRKPPLVVYDCPLFFEAGLDRLGFRKVVVVSAPLETALARIAQRDNNTHQYAKQRAELQLPLADKCRKADYVIDNSGSPAELEQQAQKLWAELKQN